eukprot:UN27007
MDKDQKLYSKSVVAFLPKNSLRIYILVWEKSSAQRIVILHEAVIFSLRILSYRNFYTYLRRSG